MQIMGRQWLTILPKTLQKMEWKMWVEKSPMQASLAFEVIQGSPRKMRSIITRKQLENIMRQYSVLSVFTSLARMAGMKPTAFTKIFRDSSRNNCMITASMISIHALIFVTLGISLLWAQTLMSIIPVPWATILSAQQKLRQWMQFCSHLRRWLISMAFISPRQQNRQMVMQMVCTMKPGRKSNRTKLREKESTDTLPCWLMCRKKMDTLQECSPHISMLHTSTMTWMRVIRELNFPMMLLRSLSAVMMPMTASMAI